MTGNSDKSTWLPAAGDGGFGHQNFGNAVRVEVDDREVRLIFEASTTEKADALGMDLLRQLKKGSITINMAGKPTSVKRIA